MGNSCCLSGLVARRAELAGEIRLLEERLEQLRSDVRHAEATIRVIGPAFELDAIATKARRPRRDLFVGGEPPRVILEALRGAREPLAGREIVLAVATARASA